MRLLTALWELHWYNRGNPFLLCLILVELVMVLGVTALVALAIEMFA